MRHGGSPSLSFPRCPGEGDPARDGAGSRIPEPAGSRRSVSRPGLLSCQFSVSSFSQAAQEDVHYFLRLSAWSTAVGRWQSSQGHSAESSPASRSLRSTRFAETGGSRGKWRTTGPSVTNSTPIRHPLPLSPRPGCQDSPPPSSRDRG